MMWQGGKLCCRLPLVDFTLHLWEGEGMQSRLSYFEMKYTVLISR